MRASKLLRKMDGMDKARFLVPKDFVLTQAAMDETIEDYQCSRVRVGDPVVYVPPNPMAEVLRCLARIESAVEALARTIPPGVVIRAGDKTYTDAKSWVAAILDGDDKEEKI